MDTRPTRLTSHGRTIANGLALVTALVALNASLTFENVWPTPRITWGHTLSPELVALVILLTLAPRLSGRLARWLLPTAWTCLVIGRYIDVTGPGLYGRDFNLYWDSRYLGDVVAMLGHDIPWWLAITGLAAGGLVVGIVFVAGRLAVRQVALAMDRPGLRLGLGVTAAIATGAYGLTATPSPAPAHRVFAAPVTSAYVRQARFVTAMLGASAVGPQLAASPDFQASLGGLGGRDVIVLFAESYGAVAWDTPGVADQLAASQRALAEAVHDTDRQVVSAYVESPTFGGSSWLAHLTLLSGVEVRDQYAYTALMTTHRDTLVRFFGRHGYRTVALMPGMRQAWPEGAFYGFDTIYGRDALAYHGPQFGW